MIDEKIVFYHLDYFASEYNRGTCGAKTDLDFSSFGKFEVDPKDYEKKKKCIIFEESTVNKINDIFSSKSSLNNIINPKDKLYFISASEFPRTHLGLFSDLKRVIKPDKCDKIVIPDSINTSTLHPYCHVFQLNDTEYMSLRTYYFSEWCKNTGVIESDIYFEKYIKAMIPNLEVEIKLITPKVINMSDIEITELLANKSKLITSKQLTQYISPNMQTMTFDEYESFNEMLASNDKSVVNLGIKMLNMYNIDKNSPTSSGIYIGLMLYNNRNNIKYYASKTTLLNYIDDTLNLNLARLSRYDDSSMYYKIAKMSSEPEQVEYINNLIEKIEDN